MSPWKGVVRFEKKQKLTPRFVGPFEIIEKVGPMAYQLDLPEELNIVHDTFHVSNLKKCLADPTLQVPLDEIRVDAKLNFVEEPVEILDKEYKKLKQSRIAIVKLFSDLMKSRFEMSMMEEMTFFLGLQVNQSPCGTFINQSKYVLEILTKYGMESCDPVGTSMEIKDKLDLDQNGTLVDATKYRSMIGALMYLTSSRPDIDFGFELTGFSDADYAGCKDSFKSTSSGAHILERVKNMEDKDGVIGDTSDDAAPIKGRSTNEGETSAERISTNSEEIARVLTSMDAATVLAGE
nr:putative reverse transcriptase domain-containing protein [Tanacetum cinerariifolium]